MEANRNQILVNNEGSAEVSGVYTISFDTPCQYVKLSNPNGFIAMGDSSLYPNETIIPYSINDAIDYPTGGYTGKALTVEDFTADNDWRFETMPTIELNGIYDNYLYRKFVFKMEVFEKNQMDAVRKIVVELSDIGDGVSKPLLKFLFNEEVIYLDDDLSPYKHSDTAITSELEANGVFLSKWGQFSGGIHVERNDNLYTFSISDIENGELFEVFTYEDNDENEWRIVNAYASFADYLEDEGYPVMDFDFMKLVKLGESIFYPGDTLLIDTSDKQRLLLNGAPFFNELQIGSVFHQFSPGESLVQVSYPLHAVIDVELEIEEKDI